MEDKSTLEKEERVIIDACRILNLPKNKSSPLHEDYRNLIEEYKKLASDYHRISKISDQQQYLIKVSEDSLKKEVSRSSRIETQLNDNVDELVESRVTAESSLETKSQFLLLMSQEIRTPLNGILGGANLLRKILSAPNHIDLVNMILSSGETLLSSINDLLDYSKIESGNLKMEVAPINLPDCIENSIEASSIGATEKKIDIIFNSSANFEKPILGDKARIGQVLVNLVKNSVKFTNQGEIIVSLDQIDRIDNKIKIYIEVKDSGIGIHPSSQKNIFDAFSQVDTSSTRHYTGTGLGLSICKKLVEMLEDGQIGVTSVPDKGTSFYFSFWAQLETDPEIETTHAWKQLGGIKALIIEDNKNALANLKNTTNSWGLEVNCALNPKDAITHINNNGIPDLFIIDTDIFSIDPTFLKSLFIACENEKIPTIFLKWADEKQNFKSSHIIQIEKPYTSYKLRLSVERLVSKLAGKKLIPVSVEEDKPIDTFSELKIMLAEDQPINQKIAIATFELLGCSVTLVENGYEAVKAAEQEEFDYIFMDLQMPMMDGIEATKNIRQLGGKQPVIVAMTAKIRKEDRDNSVKSGMDDFISKPISPELLSHIFIKWKTREQEQNE